MTTNRDSARWCDTCQTHGDHHTDRHPGGELRRYKVTQTVEVEAPRGDHAAAVRAAHDLWEAQGVEAHNERARRHSCLTVELIEDEAER